MAYLVAGLVYRIHLAPKIRERIFSRQIFTLLAFYLTDRTVRESPTFIPYTLYTYLIFCRV
jgi:hypothetical protein